MRKRVGTFLLTALLCLGAGPLETGCSCGRTEISETAVCGDGAAEAGEPCDGADLRAETCASQGFAGGTLACGQDCALDVSGCYRCGDGVRDPGEECDGTALGGNSCSSRALPGGDPLYTSDCRLDFSVCRGCGDGEVEADEQCDGAALAGKTCASFEWPLGVLACTKACTFDTSGCGNCRTCLDCSGQACIGGRCDTCSVDEDCCAPLICFFGQCTLY